MAATVKILPETDETTLCVALHGYVSATDYAEFFDSPLRSIQRVNGFYNLVIVHEADFQGWEPGAADLSFRAIASLGHTVRRAAYVNAPDSRMLMMKMMQPILNADIRFFETEQQQEAIAWAKAAA